MLSDWNEAKLWKRAKCPTVAAAGDRDRERVDVNKLRKSPQRNNNERGERVRHLLLLLLLLLCPNHYSSIPKLIIRAYEQAPKYELAQGSLGL